MNIKIIAVGKIREKYLETGIAEFVKRIQPYSSLQIIEIPSESIYSDSNIEKILEVEAEKILKHVSEGSYFITMEIAGKQLSSEDFAEKINEVSLSGINQIVFAIGGAEGLSDKVKQRADFALSFSKMTFLHQFARLLLVEQIYRAFRIIKNEPYHK
jgi:23S rRNA (pseudouridine1915-N3)-methyltransferase